MSKKEEVCALLDEKGVAYKIVEHEAAFTIEDMERLGVCSHGNVCKNLFLRDGKGKRHFLVCIHKDKTADLKKLGEKIGARLSFASEERLARYLNLTKSSVTPLGVLYDKSVAVEVIFDSDFKNEKNIGVHPCENTATLFLDFSDLESLVREHGNSVAYLSL